MKFIVTKSRNGKIKILDVANSRVEAQSILEDFVAQKAELYTQEHFYGWVEFQMTEHEDAKFVELAKQKLEEIGCYFSHGCETNVGRTGDKEFRFPEFTLALEELEEPTYHLVEYKLELEFSTKDLESPMPTNPENEGWKIAQYKFSEGFYRENLEYVEVE